MDFINFHLIFIALDFLAFIFIYFAFKFLITTTIDKDLYLDCIDFEYYIIHINLKGISSSYCVINYYYNYSFFLFSNFEKGY